MKKKVFVLLLLLILSVPLFAANVKAYKVTDGKQLSRSETTYMFGDEYSEGYLLYSQGVLLFNLKGNYKLFTATVAPTDDARLDFTYTFEFYVDGILAKTVTIEGGGLPEDVEVDLNYMRQLKIVAYVIDHGNIQNNYHYPEYTTVVVNTDFK